MCLPIPARGFLEGEPIPRSVSGGGRKRDRVSGVAEREGSERMVGPGCYLEFVVAVSELRGGSEVDPARSIAGRVP